MMNPFKKQKYDFEVGRCSDPSKYCVRVTWFTDDDAFVWGLKRLLGSSELSGELVDGKVVELPLESIAKVEWVLAKQLPLNKIFKQKNIKALTKKITKYEICKKKGGLYLKIVVEGLKEA